MKGLFLGLYSRIRGQDGCGDAGVSYGPRPKNKKPFYEFYEGKTEAHCALPLVGGEVTVSGRFETTEDFGRPGP